MVPDNTIYSDGHDVVVTNTTLKVKNTLYTLAGITRHGLSTIQPARVPGYLFTAIGVLLAIAGLFTFIPTTWIEGLRLGGTFVSINSAAFWLGIILAAIGLNLNLILKKRYAVRIATAMGEKDVVVSSHKEYISQIVRALDQALLRISKSYY